MSDLPKDVVKVYERLTDEMHGLQQACEAMQKAADMLERLAREGGYWERRAKESFEIITQLEAERDKHKRLEEVS